MYINMQVYSNQLLFMNLPLQRDTMKQVPGDRKVFEINHRWEKKTQSTKQCIHTVAVNKKETVIDIGIAIDKRVNREFIFI